VSLNTKLDDVDNLFFLNAAGGTGKTFVANALLAWVRSKGKIAMPVAASGTNHNALFTFCSTLHLYEMLWNYLLIAMLFRHCCNTS